MYRAVIPEFTLKFETRREMSTTSIEIQVNGEAHHVPAGISIDELLRGLDLQPAMIVVEHNGEILRRERYHEVRVAPGDSFELVHFVGGG